MPCFTFFLPRFDIFCSKTEISRNCLWLSHNQKCEEIKCQEWKPSEKASNRSQIKHFPSSFSFDFFVRAIQTNDGSSINRNLWLSRNIYWSINMCWFFILLGSCSSSNILKVWSSNAEEFATLWWYISNHNFPSKYIKFELIQIHMRDLAYTMLTGAHITWVLFKRAIQNSWLGPSLLFLR